MLSTLFPPDPTLTVDNVSHIMEKVEPIKRQPVLREIIAVFFNAIQSSWNLSTPLKVEAAAVDVFVNHCYPWSSWERLAGHFTVITRWLQLRE